jgi:uncharacterized OsmC-like protein
VKITLLSEDAIRLEPVPGPLTVEAESVEQQYSPFHMLGSSLAMCTFSVLYAWATHAKLSVDDLTLEVRWTFAEKPHRVGEMALTFSWPSLPASRINAAKRAAELCTIHATLSHPPTVTIGTSNDGTSITSTGSMRVVPQEPGDETADVPTAGRGAP